MNSKLVTLPKEIDYPAEFNVNKWGDKNLVAPKDRHDFVYSLTRSAREVSQYLKGEESYMLSVTIENTDETMTPTECLAWLKLPENKVRQYSVNAVSWENSCFNAVIFLKY